jgi:hypothetical protein
MKKLILFEKLHQPLLSWQSFRWRVIQNFIATLFLTGSTLGLGILGYHFICNLCWIDSLLNAAMILSGMGPVGDMIQQCRECKIFMSFYALFSGIIFISNVGLLFTPVAHRLYHRFHLIDK